jgi:hypothetical protein
MRTLTGEICLTQYQHQHGRAYNDYHARIEEAIKSDPNTFFGYVDLKKKCVGYPSVMPFEGCLASGPKKSVICLWNLYNEHIPMISGWLLILDQNKCRMTRLLTRFNSLLTRSRAFCRMSTRISAPMAYHRSFWRTVHLLSQNHYLFFSTGLWQRAFYPTGGRFNTLLRNSRKVGVTTLKTIKAWPYYLQLRSDTNCWFIEECTWRI